MSVTATVATELLVPSMRELQRLGPAVEQRAIESGLTIMSRDRLDLTAVSDQGARIPHATAVALLENSVRVSGDPAFALHAAKGIEVGDFGVYDFLARSARTLGESMSVASRYLPLLHDGAALELSERSEVVHWRHRVLPGLRQSGAANEYVVASFFFAGQMALGFSAPPDEVHFMHEAPEHWQECEAIFQAPVRFGRERNALVFPRLALEIPLASAQPALHAVLTRYADELMERLPRGQPFAQRVRALARERLEEDPSLHRVARILHMSESTVQRRLGAEGTTYTELLDEARRERAVELLADPQLNVSEVAYRLGFAHRPAFHRAFKRWHGVSPSEYRERTARSEFYRFHRRGQRSRER